MRTLTFSLFVGLVFSTQAVAAPPLDRLLPVDTTEYAYSPDMAKLEAGFHLTQFGKLWKDPALKPFKENASTEMLGWLEIPGRLGFNWHDLVAVGSGEVGAATIPISNYRIAHMALIDTTGRDAAVEAKLAAAADRAQRMGGSVAQQTIAGQQVKIFNVRDAKGKPSPIAVFRKDNILVTATPPDCLDKLLATWNAEPAKTLSGNNTYQIVRNRTRMRDGEPLHFAWYMEPLANYKATTPPAPPSKKQKGKKGGDLMLSEGFGAMKGIGGALGFAAKDADFILRMTIYAPEPSKYFGSFRMLSFQGTENLVAPSWVPSNVSKIVLATMNLRATFDAFGTIFDELAADGEKGTFEEVVQAIKKKPGVDIRGDMVDPLNGQVIAITDWVEPFTTKSERGMAILPSKNPQLFADGLNVAMRTDPKVTKRVVHGADSWESKGQAKPSKAGDPPQGPIPDVALCVANGRFHVTTNSKLLDKVLAPQTVPPMNTLDDYKRVADFWDKAGGKVACLRIFSKLSDDFRVTYEMWKANQLDKTEGLYSRCLSGWCKNGHMPLDGRKLPDYSAIGKYFGPAGIQASPYGDGWDIIGFALKP